jgi:hypothetical protein
MKLIYALQDINNPNSLANRMRRARTRHVVTLIEEAFAKTGGCRILDLGGRADYWEMFDRGFLEASKVHITLVNNAESFDLDDPMFAAIDGDACALEQFADNAFDLVHSNSVVEHVGDWPRMEAFAREARRLAPRYYVQTPYYWFPIEPHFSTPFFHWRSEQSRAKALMKRRHGFIKQAEDVGEAMREVQDARLLDKAQFRFLFPDARHVDERFAGLTKSLIAIRA